jgi:microcystin-dependent protein
MSQPFVGEIRMWGLNFAPVNWAFCNGQLLSIAQNTALFSLLGTTYGGNGVSTFALPNFQGISPMHQGQSPGTSNYPIGDTGGVPTVTLTSAQMPAHKHTLQADEEPAGDFDPTNDLVAGITAPNAFLYGPAAPPPNFLATQGVGTAGNDGPHNNMAPYLVLTFTIALNGVYPPRG